MRKFRYVSGLIILGILSFFLGACSSPAASGTIQVNVTDALPKGVTAVEIKAGNIEVHKADAADDQWISLLKDPPVFDLVKVSGVNYMLGAAEVAPGKYTQVRLDIVSVTVTIDGKQVKATVPSNTLKVVGEITVVEGKSTPISLDFDGEKSVVLQGNGEVLLKPTVKLIVAKAGEKLPAPASSAPNPTLTSTSTQTSTAASVPASTSQPVSTSAPAAMFVQITTPADESIVEDAAISISGKTLTGAIVSVNDATVDADENGNFSIQVTLEEGPNVFDITASDADGSTATTQLVVSYAP